MAALGFAGSAYADIYACRKGDVTVYQNFTCELDSIGSQASPVTGTQARAQAGDGAKAVNASSNGRKKQPAVSREPGLGMTTTEVRARWGDPATIYSDELVDGRVEIWTYDASRAVHFNPRGRVISVEDANRRER